MDDDVEDVEDYLERSLRVQRRSVFLLDPELQEFGEELITNLGHATNFGDENLFTGSYGIFAPQFWQFPQGGAACDRAGRAGKGWRFTEWGGAAMSMCFPLGGAGAWFDN